MVNQIPDHILNDQLRMHDSNVIFDKKRYFSETGAGFFDRRRIKAIVKENLSSFFQNRYGVHDTATFKRVWKQLNADKVWNSSSNLTIGTLRAIDEIFKANFIYHGPGIASPTSSTNADVTVKMVVQTLLHGGKLSRAAITKQALKAICVRKDPKLLQDFRIELQNEMDNLAANSPKNEKEELLWKAFLGNIIALLPFTYPNEGEIFSVPVLMDGVCKRVDYKMHVMPLTVTSLSSPMTALGLTPQNESKAPPILTFIGTTYPAGDGYAGTLLADFTPGKAVGESVYERNHEQIDAWLADKENVHACGTSLGGAMVMHTLRHHPKKLTKVDLYNPPGLYKRCWKKKIETDCDVKIFNQRGDVVSQMGMWPTMPNVKLYSITPHHEGIKENGISSHARSYIGCDLLTIVRRDPEKQNNNLKRRFLTTLHQALSWLFYVSIKSILLFRSAIFNIEKACASCSAKLSCRKWTVRT